MVTNYESPLSSRYADDTPLLDEARSVFPETLLANEGLTLDV